MKKIINVIAVIMLAAGFVILVKPYVSDYFIARENARIINEFRQKIHSVQEVSDSSETYRSGDRSSVSENSVSENSDYLYHTSDDTQFPEADRYGGLYRQMREYNKQIYADRQTELRDAFSYTTNHFDFGAYGITDEIAGYISIERLHLQLPLYIGSSLDNMGRGATIMNQTSMPVGGRNTNCVIAAHRSRGFFEEIEEIQTGDIIKINNLWEELEYKVVKTIVIDPYDVDKIKIVPDQDMVTLLTCHPYLVNDHRYIVYCTRVQTVQETVVPTESKDQEASQSTSSALPSCESSNNSDVSDGQTQDFIQEELKADDLPDGTPYTSSSQVIEAEHMIRMGGIALTFAFLLFYLFAFLRNITAGQRKAKSDS
ncbi:MAG: class C sortase [Clostridia bacterium]|nr:class C sortase [Clostridia bacterium]